MSLFIGNLARGLSERDLEDEFDKIGSCTVRCKVRFKKPYYTSRVLTLLLSSRTRRMLIPPSRNYTIKMLADNASPSHGAKKATNTTLLPHAEAAIVVEIEEVTEGVIVGMGIEILVHLEGMETTKIASIAASLAISPESAVREDALAADPTSEYFP